MDLVAIAVVEGLSRGGDSVVAPRDSRPKDDQGWLCPKFKRVSVNYSPENIAGCQNTDWMTGAVEDWNRIDVFIEHDVSDLADLSSRGRGQDPAIHYLSDLVSGGRPRGGG